MLPVLKTLDDYFQRSETLQKNLYMKKLLVISILFLSCNSNQQNKSKIEQMNLTNDSIANQKIDSANILSYTHSFIDSVGNKLELSVNQIKNHTSIDSVYFTGIYSDVAFIGDTVLNFNKGFKGAIINYDDRRSCIYKFLIVLDSNEKNISNKIIYSDCDHDESSDYTTVKYKFLTDSTFETIETYIPVKNKIQKTEKFKWEIAENGIIKPL